MGPTGAHCSAPPRTRGACRQEVGRGARGHPEFLSNCGYKRHVGGDRARLWRSRPSMIFIDSNIPMYLVGVPHPHKVDAQRLLENLLSERVRLVTDTKRWGSELGFESIRGWFAAPRTTMNSVLHEFSRNRISPSRSLHAS